MNKVLLILLIVVILMMFCKNSLIEGLTMKLSPLRYKDLNNPLLNNYREKTKLELTNNGSQNIYMNYPVFSASSCQNNNIRYWRRPTNGKCSPAEFCGSMYDTTEQKIPNSILESQPWTGVTRVNYYASYGY